MINCTGSSCKRKLSSFLEAGEQQLKEKSIEKSWYLLLQKSPSCFSITLSNQSPFFFLPFIFALRNCFLS